MRTPLLVGLSVLGLACAAGGLLAALHPESFASGWTAYAPLSEAAYLPVFGPPWWSLVLIAVGSAAAGAALALLVRSARDRT